MRHVFHTAGEPPSSGSTIFANRGSTQKSRNALARAVAEKSISTVGRYKAKDLGWHAPYYCATRMSKTFAQFSRAHFTDENSHEGSAHSVPRLNFVNQSRNPCADEHTLLGGR